MKTSSFTINHQPSNSTTSKATERYLRGPILIDITHGNSEAGPTQLLQLGQGFPDRLQEWILPRMKPEDSDGIRMMGYDMLYHIISYLIISYHDHDHIISYLIISWSWSYHIISYHIISYHIIHDHIISYHNITYHIISYMIISYHIIS